MYRKLQVSVGVAVFILSALSYFLPHNIYAKGIEVSPVLSEITIDVGQTGESTIPLSFFNNTSNSAQIQLSASTFGTSKTAGVPLLDTSDDPLHAFDFDDSISFSTNSFTLEPNEKATVAATLNEVQYVPSGGHYGVIHADVLTDVAGPASQVAIKYSLSSLVLLKKLEGEVIDFAASKLKTGSSFWNTPDTASVEFGNMGNTHVVPRGVILIKDIFGRTIRKGSINTQSVYIIPKTERIVESKLEKVSNFWFPGIYRIETIYRSEGSTDSQNLKKFTFIGGGYFIVFAGVIIAILAGMYLLKKNPRIFNKVTKKYPHKRR